MGPIPIIFSIGGISRQNAVLGAFGHPADYPVCDYSDSQVLLLGRRGLPLLLLLFLLGDVLAEGGGWESAVIQTERETFMPGLVDQWSTIFVKLNLKQRQSGLGG